MCSFIDGKFENIVKYFELGLSYKIPERREKY